MAYRTIERDNYIVEFSEPTVYIDNQARGRSGHMTHAMAGFSDQKFLNFNSNCSPVRADGHAAYGWVEYRMSEDAGKTYGELQTLPYSWDSFLDGVFTVAVEKAVVCDDGSVVAICLRNTMLQPVCCEPWLTPMWIRSTDEGKTWSEPKELSPHPGRPYAATYHKGVIYVLHFCSEYFLGSKPEHVYRLYVSEDNGLTFQERCVVPFPDTIRRSYCALLFDEQERLHAYTYNEAAEDYMDHAVSCDCGHTWEILAPCYLAKGIRNNQIAVVDGIYVAHGRSADVRGFVIYTSENGQDWDEGIYFNYWDHQIAQYYSNNIRLRDEKGDFLLIQYSESYDGSARVNIKHVELRVKKKGMEK